MEITFTRRTLRVQDVAEKTGLAESTIWRLAQRRLFPPPFKLSPGCTAWYEHEIDNWLAAKAAARELRIDAPWRDEPCCEPAQRSSAV
jgi:prophage regulatory protein